MATIIGYANQIDNATLTGGNWNTSYPASNLQTRDLWKKARTNNALASSSVINLDLGQLQNIGVVALCRHNLADTANVRIQAFDDAGYSIQKYDSTATVIYSGTEYCRTFPKVEARYWRISISDPTNVNGYIELGRIFIGWRFAPGANIDWGASLTVESTTTVATALAGPEYFDERPNRRIWQGKWSWLDDYEAYKVYLSIQRQQDISREVYLIEDDADTDYRAERWFLGRFRSLSAIEWPYLNTHSIGVEISEVL